MKLYAKIKVGDAWHWVPAGSIQARQDALDKCQCRVCAWTKGGPFEEEE